MLSFESRSSSREAAATPAFLKGLLATNLLVIPIILIVVGLILLAPNFASARNVENIARLAAIYAIIGVGQTFVMTSANIDLSVGSMAALIMALVGSVVLGGYGVPAGILLALLLGAAMGALNGVIVTKLKIPALLATLGVLVTYRGAVQEYMYGSYHVRFPESLRFLGQGSLFGIPMPVVVALLVAVAGWLILHRTRFGRHVIAVGSNEQAARRAGIDVDRVKIGVFALQGFLVGLAAILFMGRLNSAHPSFGVGLELHIIAGVVLGGTLLFGGYGAIVGTVLGMLLIGILENGLLLAGARRRSAASMRRTSPWRLRSAASAMAWTCRASMRDSRPTVVWSSSTGRRDSVVVSLARRRSASRATSVARSCALPAWPLSTPASLARLFRDAPAGAFVSF